MSQTLPSGGAMADIMIGPLPDYSRTPLMQRLILPYLSGFLSVMFFQQSIIGMLHAAGFTSQVPFDLTPMAAFGIPSFLVFAIAAGLYAVLMAWLFRVDPSRPAPWLAAFVYGAILPTAVAIFVIGPIQGMWPTGNILPRIAFGAVSNGFWGWGALIMIRALSPLPPMDDES